MQNGTWDFKPMCVVLVLPSLGLFPTSDCHVAGADMKGEGCLATVPTALLTALASEQDFATSCNEGPFVAFLKSL